MTVAQGISTTFARVKQSALGSPGSTGSALARRVTATFNLDRDKYNNNEITSHQQGTGDTAGIGKTSGKLNALLSAGTYSLEFAALLRKLFVATTPITALSITIAGSGPTYTITRSSGWWTDGIKVGDVIRLSVGTLNAANISKNLLITALTQTVATVMPLNGVALVAEGPITGCTVTVIGKKSWVPTSGHTNEYFTWEKGHADLTKYELFTDVKVAMADIALPASGNATVNFDLPGLGRTLGTSATLTSPTAETTSTVLSSVQGKVLVGGTATSITGAQIQINGNIQPGEAEVGSNSISDHQRGRVTVTGSFTAKFTSTTLQAIFDAQTATSLVLVVADSASATAEFVTFVMTNIKLFSDTADDGEKEIIRTYSFTAAIDGAGGAALANNQTIISIQDSLAA